MNGHGKSDSAIVAKKVREQSPSAGDGADGAKDRGRRKCRLAKRVQGTEPVK
jgi:hypothetical protein